MKDYMKDKIKRKEEGKKNEKKEIQFISFTCNNIANLCLACNIRKLEYLYFM